MTATARSGFFALVVATFAAFFVAQELKSTPPLVQDLKVTPFFSPNRDGRFDRAYASFVLKRPDDVTATVIDRAGDDVLELTDNEPVAVGERLRLAWRGTDADGRPVADGTYRIRVGLRRQGRSVTLPRNIVKDTTPPVVVVTSIGPQADVVPRAELLPRADGEPARVSFRADGRRKEIHVFRTDVQPPRAVFDAPVELPDAATRWEWDGTAGGRRVVPGTYLVVVRARDRAGNIGSSAPVPPRLRFGERLRGRGGITVRYLTAQAPTAAVTARETASVAVDSAGERFTWTLRRVGEPDPRKRGSGSRSRLVEFAAPGGKSGLYVFEARTRTRSAAAPLLVQARRPRDVLVVLPATTWQGLNARDDDGDGRPNTLRDGLAVRIARPYAGDGLPPQIRTGEALLLAQLDRAGRRYDLTTDVALAGREGASLRGYRGIVLAGDARWLDGRVGRRLRAFVRGGGRLLSVGVDSLRRSVTLTPRGRAIEPTQPTARDLFDARLRAVRREPVTLVNLIDEIELFAGTTGQFAAIDAYEQTLDVRGGARALAAAAATQDGDRQVVVAARFGDGLVIRTGLPAFSASLRSNAELAELLDRIWVLLRSR